MKRHDFSLSDLSGETYCKRCRTPKTVQKEIYREMIELAHLINHYKKTGRYIALERLQHIFNNLDIEATYCMGE